jgi:arabinogalactan endo-1,4-beta-galactosidase
MMKNRIAAPLIAVVLLAGCGESATQPDDGLEPDTFDILIGGDVSFLAEIEDNGGTYSDADGEKDLLLLMKEHGFESIRLRLWHTPAGSYNDLEQVKTMAARIEAAGMELFLDFHYSDWWADAGTQNKPAAWSGLAFDILVDSVYQYSYDVIASLQSQGTVPSMVQIGNEISSGMLWPDGQVGGAYDTPQQWDQLSALLDAGRRGVLDAAPNQRPEIVIHFSNGADNAACRWFFDGLAAHGLQYDAIGVSYYPKWHGSLAQLRYNLNDLANRYQRDVYVVETAYPWTFDWVDDANNIWGSESDLHPGYPATVAGQSDFLRALRNIVAVVPGGRGGGIYYWSPEWIAVQGVPSAWENATLFDFDGMMLPSMEAFTGME